MSIILAGGLIASVVIFVLGFIFSTNIYHNASAVSPVTDTVSATLETSCAMTSNTPSAHSINMSNGEKKSGIGITNLTVSCNDANGFAIYAIGFSDDTDGKTNMVSSVGSEYYIPTGTDTTGNVSSWAMMVTPGTGIISTNGFNNYSAVPTTFTRVAEKTSGVQLGSTAAASTTYQVYTSDTQPAGTYTGKVKYVLVHPSTEDCPEGYILEGGECKKPPLYMQDVATWGSTLTLEQSIQAVDKRDNKAYWATRLCTDASYKTSSTCNSSEIWMTQNLDYDIKSTGNEVSTIDGATTTWDSPDGATSTSLIENTGYTGTVSWDPGDYYVEHGGGSTACTTWRPTGACGNTKSTVSLVSIEAKDKTELHYHLGNYYQWNAATAGTGGTIKNQDATSSICPEGWRLPASNSYTARYSFGALTNAYGITNSTTGSSDAKLLSSPLWFVRAGNVTNEGLGLQGTYGRVWSSFAHPTNASLAYRLQFRSSLVDPSNNYNRNFGYSVRCVAL